MSSYPIDARFAERPAAALIHALDQPLEDAWRRLRSTLRGLGARPIDDRTAAALFVNLPHDLLWTIERSAVVELERARSEGALRGATPAERYDDFVATLVTSAGRARFWSRHSLLAQLASARIDRVLSAMVELATRLVHAWPALTQTFDLPRDATLSTVRMWRTGSYRGARSIARLELGGRIALRYVPHSLAAQAALDDAFVWLNEHGFGAPLRGRRQLLCGDHGFCDEIEPRACDAAALARFHRRQGAHLALLYLLHGTGVTYCNVVAAGEHPMLIDVERLFTPAAANGELHALAHVGYLPERSWPGGGEDGVDIGALAMPDGARTVRPRPALVDARTDRMRFERVPGRWRGGHNRPRCDGREVDAADWVDAIISGFVEAYELIRRSRSPFVAGPLAAFADVPLRVAMHPASVYVAFLLEGTHPDVLVDRARRAAFFARLGRGAIGDAACDALAGGDAPVFTMRPTRRELDADGRCIHGFFAEPPMTAVRRRIAGMSDGERERCVAEIAASFARRV
ncbi:MAG: Lanthionine biosynthesis protein LanM [bacterium]|nr:Lanthionine biosynthesis protein LanM [bacterium]